MRLLHNRKEAGQELAKKLANHPTSRDGPLCVVALPRGGVPVAAEIAKALHAPMCLVSWYSGTVSAKQKGQLWDRYYTVAPQWLDAVGSWYMDFPQVTDEEVCALLNEAQSAVADEVSNW
jgi:predicted phosphoribosyltransferase